MAIATGTALALGGAAALGAGTSAWAAHEQSGAIGDAAKTSAKASTAATEMQLAFLRENRADIAEAVERGMMDLDSGFSMAISELRGIPTGPYAAEGEINQARALLNNPDSIKDRGSYKFQFGQGIEALQSGFSKSGGGGVSGRTMKAAEEYGQNFAATMLDQEINRLFGVAGQSFNMENADRQNQIGQINNIASLFQNLGSQKANLRVGAASQTANLTGNTANAVAQNTVNTGLMNADAVIQKSNALTQGVSNAAGGISDLLSLYAVRPELFKSS